ncbi:MAG TPA: hypothetical protein VN754_12030 [Candidatus Binataceae bacterium]|nr:hypothetical protein [Candidatus Binataceae bacterium]
MASPQQIRGQAGATNLRPGDIIVALALLGLLLYAAWKQFPRYGLNAGSPSVTSSASHQP